jgi:extracellular factor (EF) 3-hydroxypalmitic acid methyl ester biosynthesis protein
MGTANGELQNTLILFETNQGAELRGSLLRLTRFLAVFELYSPSVVLRSSEVLTNCRIIIHERTLYSGRAVIHNLVNAGLTLVCEATLNESAWKDVQFAPEMARNGELRTEFKGFLDGWQNLYRIKHEFKGVMADFQTFLTDLRMWLEQVELEIRASPSGDRHEAERNAVSELAKPAIDAIDGFVERFESIAVELEPEFEPAHRSFMRRQLHPLVLCSPFAYRSFHKPLGYAGDYEAVDMMLRSPHEGSTLFAKIINVWLLDQAPVRAHRNRVDYLSRKLAEEGLRARMQGHIGRVYNLGCGPAAEIQCCLRDQPGTCNHLQFTLLDFNEETLAHLRSVLNELRTTHNRSTRFEIIKRSVHQVLKESGRVLPGQYDLVYCAGLFDYLSDNVCKRLMNIFYDMLAPGGLLIATNVSDAMNGSRPFRYSLEYLLDWHLIYRNARQFSSLAPDRAPADSVSIIAEDTGVNVFIEVRKPNHA